jgi:5'-phosphate synthase pdxT subunit
MKAGVLAIQGDFAAHARMLQRIGIDVIEVRRAVDLDQIGGLILPGGESTAMLKFLTEESLSSPLIDFAHSGRTIFGTCAGAILLAREVSHPAQSSLGLIDITVERNAYGRQVDSFIDEIETVIDGGRMEAVFIRAPRITRVGSEVEILATNAGQPVFVREGNIIAATFHPELSRDERAHRLFAESLVSDNAMLAG